MSFYESRRSLNGVEIRPGAAWSADPSVELRFAIMVTCTDVTPDRYRGALTLQGVQVWAGEPRPTYAQAVSSARDHLLGRLSDLLG